MLFHRMFHRTPARHDAFAVKQPALLDRASALLGNLPADRHSAVLERLGVTPPPELIDTPHARRRRKERRQQRVGLGSASPMGQWP